MYQIDNSTAVSTLPQSTTQGTAGYFTDGNPRTGLPATILPAEFLNMLMSENLNILKAAGIEPSKKNHDQVIKSLQSLFLPIDAPTLPSGGNKDMALVKKSNEDSDVEWKFISGVPIGTVEYFATATPPAGYLKADGAAVGRETYKELFAAIGTTFGAGDGSTTFNLPDLIDRFAQGSNTPGQKIEAGLPNITGRMGSSIDFFPGTGALFTDTPGTVRNGEALHAPNGVYINIDAHRSSPIYGASNTVQPPALTLLPCIKAFDAATNPGLIDITELANEMAGKVDRYIDNKPVRYVIDAYSDGTNWYRKWSDGWLEQGGCKLETVDGFKTLSLLLPFANTNYQVLVSISAGSYYYIGASPYSAGQFSYQGIGHVVGAIVSPYNFYWCACGQGA